jgi:hypothetical protein
MHNFWLYQVHEKQSISQIAKRTQFLNLNSGLLGCLRSAKNQNLSFIQRRSLMDASSS